MAAQLKQFQGFRASGVRQSNAAALTPRSPVSTRQASQFCVVAQKKVQKKLQIILKEDIVDFGKKGDLKRVPLGYFRNYLSPNNLAAQASDGILRNIEKEKQAEIQRKQQIKAKAQGMAVALSTIGKFIVRKKVGEGDRIFGSVQAAEVCAAIAQQTGRELDAKDLELPEIKTLGTYDASIKLHPEVTGFFKVVVQKEKQS